jgi:glycosyltransferase involved in cell wall biosynthesis
VTEPAKYSIVVPIYGNESGISHLLSRLSEVTTSIGAECEVVFVVDGSPDRSYEILVELLPHMDLFTQLIRHSRNFGSFAAIRTGMSHATGEFIAVMAADLQEPPELILDFFATLDSGEADVVVGRREARDDPFVSKISSGVFWNVYKRWIFPEMPEGGVDIFGCNRDVALEILALDEAHSSLIGLLYWVGFRRKEIPYRRQPREHGKSGWSFSKKVRYLLDSVFSFTDIPLTLLIAVGAIGSFVTLLVSFVVFAAYLFGSIQEPGYTPLMMVILFSTFTMLVALGIVGSYVWRAFENTKRRPGAIVMSRWNSDA